MSTEDNTQPGQTGDPVVKHLTLPAEHSDLKNEWDIALAHVRNLYGCDFMEQLINLTYGNVVSDAVIDLCKRHDKLVNEMQVISDSVQIALRALMEGPAATDPAFRDGVERQRAKISAELLMAIRPPASNEKLVAALEWIGHFDDDYLRSKCNGTTLHIDMAGRAREALGMAAPRDQRPPLPHTRDYAWARIKAALVKAKVLDPGEDESPAEVGFAVEFALKQWQKLKDATEQRDNDAIDRGEHIE